jgi:hypothetical protein
MFLVWQVFVLLLLSSSSSSFSTFCTLMPLRRKLSDISNASENVSCEEIKEQYVVL